MRLSGTSMASPENMLLYTYLISVNSNLSVEEGLGILRKGVVRDESLRDEVESQGVTIPSAVYVEFLLHMAHTQGLLEDYTLPPRLHVSPTRSKELLPDPFPIPRRSMEEPSYSELPALGPLLLDAKKMDPRYYTFWSIRVLEALLTSPVLGTDSEPLAESQARDALSRIDESLMHGQGHLLRLFFEEPEIQAFELSYDLPQLNKTASFWELYTEHLRPKLLKHEASLYELTWVLEFAKRGGAPTREELQKLKSDFLRVSITPQYTRTIFIRLLQLYPELRPTIHELFSLANRDSSGES